MSSVRGGKNPILLGALIGLSAAVLWLSAVQISRMARFGVLPQAAYRIDSGVAVEKAAITALVPVAEELRATGVCQAIFVKSGFTVELAALDLEDQTANYAAWATALDRAEIFARHALGCLPTNGNFWLRFAMLRQAVGEQPNELLELVRNSQAYAPAEAEVVAGRYAFYNRLTGGTLTLLSDIIAKDIGVICSESGSTVRERLAAPSPAVDRIVRSIAPRCALAGNPT